MRPNDVIKHGRFDLKKIAFLERHAASNIRVNIEPNLDNLQSCVRYKPPNRTRQNQNKPELVQVQSGLIRYGAVAVRHGCGTVSVRYGTARLRYGFGTVRHGCGTVSVRLRYGSICSGDSVRPPDRTRPNRFEKAVRFGGS